MNTPIRLLLCSAFACFSLMFSPAASAQLVLYEGFDYSAGSLTTQNGGTGWGGAWTNGATGAVQVVTGGSLTGPTNSFATTGNRTSTTVGSGNPDADRFMSASGSARFNFNTNSTTYFSFLLNKTNGGASNDFAVVRMFDTAGVQRVELGINTNEAISLNLNGSSTTTANSFYTAGSDIQLVLRVDTVASGNDSLSLWAFPSSGSTPGTESTPLLTVGGVDVGNVTVARIRLIQGANTTQFDEIRGGSSWASVVAIPEPSTAALLVAAMAGMAVLRRRRQA